MKRILSFILFVAVSLVATFTALAAGQEEKGTATSQVTLLFWPGPESDAMRKVIDAYNIGEGKTDGVSVKQLLFSRQGFFDRELKDLAAASTQFDLIPVTTYTLGSYAPYLAQIDSYATADAVKLFIPSTLDTLRLKGNLYGVPTEVSVHFLYYRSDLISRLQSDRSWAEKYSQIAKSVLGQDMTPQDPADWIWNDYLATALFFTKALNPDSPVTYGTVLQLKNLIFNIMIWDDVLASNGGNWLDAQGNVIINSPEARASLQIYQTIIDNKATPPGSTNYEFPETNMAFSTGLAATALQWNAAFPILNDPKRSPLVAGKVGIAPIPAGSAGHKTHEHSLGIGLNNASKNKDAAGKFLAYLLSQGGMEIYAMAGGTPPVSSVLSAMATKRPDFSKVAEYLDKYGYIINDGTASYAVPVYQILADEFSEVWTGQKTIDAALANGALRMTSTISK